MASVEPIIGICATLERASWGYWDAEAALVPGSYLRAIAKARATALLIPPTFSGPAECDGLLDRVDGVLLIGGVDVDPSCYGAQREPRTETGNSVRDEHELMIARTALSRDLPILGICRGMQLLNVSLGGTLVQDLDEAGYAVHRRSVGSFEGTDHVVRVETGSLVHAATGESTHVVHCHHHQAVDRLGTALRVVARAADGVVEAVESSEHRFAVGVQWHPEANECSQIIGGFVRAAHRRTGPALRPTEVAVDR